MKREQIVFTHPKAYSNIKRLNIGKDSVCLGNHFHTAIEMILVENGSILCHTEDKDVRIPQNKVFILGSNSAHYLSYDNAPAQICYLQFDVESVLQLIYPEYDNLPLMPIGALKKYEQFSENSIIYRLFQSVLCELDEKKPYFETVAIGILIQLMSHLQREGIVPDYEKLSKDLSFKKITPVIEYANKHYSEKVCLNDLSCVLHTDKYYLCKIFKKTTGMTFFQYLNRVRLYNAEILLVSTSKSIMQIALECGFSTAQYFNSTFVKAKGCSPSQYRKAYYKNSTM